MATLIPTGKRSVRRELDFDGPFAMLRPAGFVFLKEKP